MTTSARSPETERYKIDGFDIIDTKGEVHGGTPIYIRIILDSLSAELKSSEISFKDRLDIVGTIGLKALTDVLAQCFESANKGYNAEKEAVHSLGVLLRGAYPALAFVPVSNDSGVALQLVLPGDR